MKPRRRLQAAGSNARGLPLACGPLERLISTDRSRLLALTNSFESSPALGPTCARPEPCSSSAPLTERVRILSDRSRNSAAGRRASLRRRPRPATVPPTAAASGTNAPECARVAKLSRAHWISPQPPGPLLKPPLHSNPHLDCRRPAIARRRRPLVSVMFARVLRLIADNDRRDEMTSAGFIVSHITGIHPNPHDRVRMQRRHLRPAWTQAN